MKIKQLYKWVFGYTVSFVTLDKIYNVKHRIGRQPQMWVDKVGRGKGKSYSHIYFDEWSQLSPEDLKEIGNL
jgi:hypothetical protein